MERIRRNASVEYHSSRFILALKVIEPAAIPAGTFFTGLGANDGPLWATSFNFSVINGANYSVGWLVLRNIDYEMGYGTCFFVSESKFLRLKESVS